MNEITLREINHENWQDCLELCLAPEQQDYLKSNAYSLVQAHYEPDCYPWGIYHQDQMVGFVMYGKNPQGQWWILRLMIDYLHQGLGYGTVALQKVIDQMKTHPDCHEIFLDYVQENLTAAKLYHRFGFRPTGEINDNLIVLQLTL